MLKPKFKAKRLTINVSIIKFTIIIELNARKGLKFTLQVINIKFTAHKVALILMLHCLSNVCLKLVLDNIFYAPKHGFGFFAIFYPYRSDSTKTIFQYRFLFYSQCNQPIFSRSIIPVVMAGIIAIYGVVVSVLIAGELDAAPKYTLYK